MAVDGLRAALDSGDLEEMVRAVRTDSFFYLLPSMGLLLLAPFAMAAAWRRRHLNPAEWSFALTCFAIFAIGAIAWGLLLFGNLEDRTILHVCSYLLPLLGIAGAVVGLRAVFPRFALYYVGLSALFSLAVYAPVLDPAPGTVYSRVAIVLAALALGTFGFLTLRGEGEPPPIAEDSEPAQAS
jgi:hypothetical protein